MRNIALTLAYDGTDFAGFQRQRNAPSIQAELERALLQFEKKPTRVIGAGRTDAGVHARGQVAAFHSTSTIPTRKIPDVLNAALPPSIRVLRAREVPDDFHPRFSAKARVYAYYLTQGAQDPFAARFSWRVRVLPAVAPMRKAALPLLGTHDFQSFGASVRDQGTTVRQIHRIHISQNSVEMRIVIEANAFLRKMARSLAGVLIAVGFCELDIADPAKLLAAKNRNAVKHLAPACGLFLENVKY